MKPPRKRPLLQVVMVVFLISVVASGMWLARNDPDTDWGLIVITAMGLIGFIIRGIFDTPKDAENDGYDGR